MQRCAICDGLRPNNDGLVLYHEKMHKGAADVVVASARCSQQETALETRQEIRQRASWAKPRNQEHERNLSLGIEVSEWTGAYS